MADAVRKLHDAINHRPECRIVPMRLVITYAEARELDELIHDLCRDEGECPKCKGRICPACDVDDCRCEVVL